MNLMFQPFMRYADFNGRARRSEYWLWCLFLFLANSALMIVQFAVIGGMAGAASNGQGQSDAAAAGALGGVMIMSLIRLAFALAVLIPSVAVSVRRMHDTNRTGWWIIFPSVVALIAAIIYFSVDGANFLNALKGFEGLPKDGSDPTAVFQIMGTLMKPLAWIILPATAAKLVTFIFRVLDGTPGNNRFGPDPKGRGGNVSVF